MSIPIPSDHGRAIPASDEATPVLPGLSPICGHPIDARFDGGMMSSDGGLLVLRQIEQRLGIARRLAACMHDPWAPERIAHGLDEITAKVPAQLPDNNGPSLGAGGGGWGRRGRGGNSS